MAKVAHSSSPSSPSSPSPSVVRFLGRNRLGNRHIDFRHSSPSSPIPKYRDIWTKTLWIPIKISVWRKTDNIGDISPILSAFSSMGTISIRYICPSFWSGALSF
ncbi:uncharacterized protein LOC126617692 isoform X2 [Malus sylvestris]|uniref:uncharacterized protein LOC126617692 isoform X2 n=1 Tax=Malus sylvestris TaxID=3752 RepID=UPI0021AC6520|nr:uncharacterized protein LOC126617692 isoform X2 [Malus sylvestris]